MSTKNLFMIFVAKTHMALFTLPKFETMEIAGLIAIGVVIVLFTGAIVLLRKK